MSANPKDAAIPNTPVTAGDAAVATGAPETTAAIAGDPAGAGNPAVASNPAVPGPATVTRPMPAQARPAAGPRRPSIAGGASKDPMARYLEMFGVSPGASLDSINTAYFMLLKRHPQNPTEEDEKYMQEVRRAYDIVRRRYVPPAPKGLKVVFDKRIILPLMAIGVLGLAVTFLWMNWNRVRMSMTHYAPGAVLRLKNASTPYGTVTGYESTHRFPAGVAGPAYSMKLTGKEETVWVSERLVVLGMVPAGK